MAVAELCLNEGKKGLGTKSGIEARHTDCDKSEKEVITLLREGFRHTSHRILRTERELLVPL